MGFILYLDSVLIPFSLFLVLGYHVYLWQRFKQRPSTTKMGLDKSRRETWFQALKQGDDKMGMLAIQSLRNALMATILNATIAIMVNLALAALINNAYNAGHIFRSEIFGWMQSGRMYSVKYGTASLFVLVSFLYSSLALGFLIDANFLINASDDRFSSLVPPSHAYTHSMFERGFAMAFIGNRMLCVSVPLLLWIFGTLPVVVSSIALVWGLYGFDFVVAGKCEINAD